MSFSTSHLESILRTPPPDEWYGVKSRVPKGERNLENIIREGQNRLKAPHLRDHGYRLPIPFRWGPNGSILLLLAMLSPVLALAIWAALR